MTHEQLRSSTVARTLGDVVGDFTDLLQKEVRLARAELSANLSVKLQGGIWMGVAAAWAGITLLLLAQAFVFAIATYGVPLHWSCLIVASATAIIAAVIFFIGRADARLALTPRRTLHQIQQDIVLSKEQLT